jgi:hypothetical protein
VATEVHNFLGLKSATAAERHFAVLCRDKIQVFSGLTCAKKLEAPGCIYLKNCPEHLHLFL